MENIIIIQTGGTIDKDYPRATGGYAFEISEPSVLRVLSRAKSVLKYHIETVCRKDSQEITANDRENIVQRCRETSNTKILITHGTDTLLDTALYIDRANLVNKTVVLTGAHKPEAFKDSDADFNIGVAVGALQCLQSAGVYVAMNGRVHRASEVKRDMNTGQFVSETQLKNM